jgi:hypothetical protein
MRSDIVRIILLTALAAGALHAQVHAPRIGAIRCSDGGVRAVYGLAGNFIVADHPFAMADAVSFSDRAGLIAAKGKIQLLGLDGDLVGEYKSREANPILNVDGDPSTAVAWLPSERAVLRWTGTDFRGFPAPAIEGRVASIRAAGADRVQLLILNDDGSASRATVALPAGDLVSLDTVPGVSGPVIREQNFLIFRDGKKLAIETSDGIQHTLRVPSSVVIERMSSEWLHLSLAGKNRHWALHLAGSQPELFILPDVRATEEAKK